MAAEPNPIQANEYVAPQVGRKVFHCPYCRVYAQQRWHALTASGPGPFTTDTSVRYSTCSNCRKHTIWLAPDDGSNEELNSRLLEPLASTAAPPAHVDMADDPRADYEEARGIVERSPRGAVALLRLAVQKLMMSLGLRGENINRDIGALVRDGLPVRVQQALDTLRVTGNNAVHPGQIDLSDDRERAVALFGLMNYIVEQQITQPRELASIYEALPESSREQIEKRDASESS
jgi:Domain of unknown function (DUF4145)